MPTTQMSWMKFIEKYPDLSEYYVMGRGDIIAHEEEEYDEWTYDPGHGPRVTASHVSWHESCGQPPCKCCWVEVETCIEISDGNAHEEYDEEEEAEYGIKSWWANPDQASKEARDWLDRGEADRKPKESLQDYADRICQGVAEANGVENFSGHGNYYVSAADKAGMNLRVKE